MIIVARKAANWSSRGTLGIAVIVASIASASSSAITLDTAGDLTGQFVHDRAFWIGFSTNNGGSYVTDYSEVDGFTTIVRITGALPGDDGGGYVAITDLRIDSIVAGSKQIFLHAGEGDLSSFFSNGMYIQIESNSTAGNNTTYTVASCTFTGGKTRITTNETIAGSTGASGIVFATPIASELTNDDDVIVGFSPTATPTVHISEIDAQAAIALAGTSVVEDAWTLYPGVAVSLAGKWTNVTITAIGAIALLEDVININGHNISVESFNLGDTDTPLQGSGGSLTITGNGTLGDVDSTLISGFTFTCNGLLKTGNINGNFTENTTSTFSRVQLGRVNGRLKGDSAYITANRIRARSVAIMSEGGGSLICPDLAIGKAYSQLKGVIAPAVT